MALFSYLSPNIVTTKTISSDLLFDHNNDEKKSDDNIDVTCINDAVVLVSISYQIDSFTATNILEKPNGSVKKRKRNDTEKVSVFIDKLDEGLFVAPHYNSNTDENEEILLKPLKQYTVYAD